MQSPVTGYRKGASSKVRCIDVAALVAAAFLRKNRNARVLPFEVNVVQVPLNPRDSVMTNAAALAKVGGGGTNCSAPLAMLNKEKSNADLVIFISDNESWADPKANRGTAMMAEWEKLRNRNPKAKLVCIDIVPNTTTQAPDRKDILNIADSATTSSTSSPPSRPGPTGPTTGSARSKTTLTKHMKTA